VGVAFFLGGFVRKLELRERTGLGYERMKGMISEMWYSGRDGSKLEKNMVADAMPIENYTVSSM
jgi:hypothetical protein